MAADPGANGVLALQWALSTTAGTLLPFFLPTISDVSFEVCRDQDLFSMEHYIFTPSCYVSTLST